MKRGLWIIVLIMISSVYALNEYQGVKVTVLPGIFIISPSTNGIYTSREVLVSFTSDEKIDVRYSDNGRDFAYLCKKCDYYAKLKPFDDGNHNLTFQTTFSTGAIIETVYNFTVDFKKPVIKNIEPKGEFANGRFSIEFEEANPVLVVLNYGNDINGYKNFSLDINRCEKNINIMRCSADINLSKYDQQTIIYWFNVKDISNKQTESDIKYVKVDFQKPVINSFNYIMMKYNFVNFILNISELNFDRATYIDSKDIFHIKRVLCNRLKNNICEYKVAFAKGFHNIKIEVFDKSGNFETRNANFSI